MRCAICRHEFVEGEDVVKYNDSGVSAEKWGEYGYYDDDVFNCQYCDDRAIEATEWQSVPPVFPLTDRELLEEVHCLLKKVLKRLDTLR